jgi:HK97 family phage portal protein
MMQSTDKGKFSVEDKPLASGLHNAPNDEMTTMEFRETLTGHCVLQGNAYSRVFRRSGSGVAQELWPLQPSQVRPDRDKQKRLVYLVKEGNSPEQTYTVERGKAQDILHVPGIGWDGIHGYSVLTMARQSIGTANAAERHVGRFYARGGRTPYNLKLNQANVFEDDEAFKKFRGEWNEVYSDPSQAPILETWLDYVQTGISLKDSQMLESRQFSVQEICRWFRSRRTWPAICRAPRTRTSSSSRWSSSPSRCNRGSSDGSSSCGAAS